MKPRDSLRVTRLGDTDIAWAESGSGSPLLLLHGLGDCHRTWRRVVPALAEHHRVITPDLPGHGLSGRPDAPYTLEWYASTLRAFLDALELERVDLAGHSYGGGVAQWMLLERPERYRRLVLVAPGGLGREVGIGMRLAAFPVLGPLLAPAAMRVGTRVMMRIAAGELGNPEPEEIDRLAWMNSMPGSGRAFTRTVCGCVDLLGQHQRTWDRIHLVPELPPVTLHWGTKDRIVPYTHALRARERLVGAELSSYAGSGHFPHLDHPQRFAGEVARFLDDENPTPRPVLCQVPRSFELGGAVVHLLRRIGRAVGRVVRGIAA
ncbi:MAG: alpha/beta fold hydrolase [Polyangiaceae bacterium]